MAEGMVRLAEQALAQGRTEEAQELYEECLKIQRQLGNVEEVATVLHRLGTLQLQPESVPEACALFAESLQLWRQLGDEPEICRTLLILGLSTDEPEQALPLLDEGLEMSRRLNDVPSTSLFEFRPGCIAETLGHLEEAQRCYLESLAIERQLGMRENLFCVLQSLGLLAEQQRKWDEARRYYSECLEIVRAMGGGAGEQAIQERLAVVGLAEVRMN